LSSTISIKNEKLIPLDIMRNILEDL